MIHVMSSTFEKQAFQLTELLYKYEATYSDYSLGFNIDKHEDGNRVNFRVYHGKGYCFDIYRDETQDDDGNAVFEYGFWQGHEGFETWKGNIDEFAKLMLIIIKIDDNEWAIGVCIITKNDHPRLPKYTVSTDKTDYPATGLYHAVDIARSIHFEQS